ncbi:Uncharacterized protein TCM_043801 [Theobroma cacao]|uniref:DUF4283 domain-containing protein n=1 Tax=Theobroma cacao TaxID=3641 RepID=A0A061FQA7_THECC|nr:Uncharacterized protein TCM_043801 [Theobroma cacao]
MVGKFSRMQHMQEIRTAFKGIGLVGAYEIRRLDYKHILIQRARSQQDMVKADLVYFEPKNAYGLAPLMVDEATANGTRPSVARVCVEYDCQKPPIEQVWIVIRDSQTRSITGGYMQKVEFTKLSEFCSHCCHVGHGVASCMDTVGKAAEPQKETQHTNVPIHNNFQMIMVEEKRRTKSGGKTGTNSGEKVASATQPQSLEGDTRDSHVNEERSLNGTHANDKDIEVTVPIEGNEAPAAGWATCQLSFYVHGNRDHMNKVTGAKDKKLATTVKEDRTSLHESAKAAAGQKLKINYTAPPVQAATLR